MALRATKKNLDVVIFGASGFTGKYTIFEGVKILSDFKWGIAGRNREKLEKTLVEIGQKANKDLSQVPIIVADVDDESSLKKMSESCKIVVNCCGPYRLYGESVIKACIETKTHHVDVSGEPQFLEGMQLKYHEKAKENGVWVIPACGFGSIPVDMGTIFLEKQFENGTLNSVECYIESNQRGPRTLGNMHYGSWQSVVHAVANKEELPQIRKELFKVDVPKGEPILEERPTIHKSAFDNKWSLPYHGFDRSCVERTQRFLYETENKRPVQMKAYISFDGLIPALAVSFVSAMVVFLAKFNFGKNLLLNHPRIFSLGFVSHEGPSDEAMKNTYFDIHFEGRGWDYKLTEPTDKYTTPPNMIVKAKISGTNPGYGATCVALLLAAKTILVNGDKMPGGGGCLPPGAAFAKTDIISELCNNGYTVEIVSKEKI